MNNDIPSEHIAVIAHIRHGSRIQAILWRSVSIHTANTAKSENDFTRSPSS